MRLWLLEMLGKLTPYVSAARGGAGWVLRAIPRSPSREGAPLSFRSGAHSLRTRVLRLFPACFPSHVFPGCAQEPVKGVTRLMLCAYLHNRSPSLLSLFPACFPSHVFPGRAQEPVKGVTRLMLCAYLRDPLTDPIGSTATSPYCEEMRMRAMKAVTKSGAEQKEVSRHLHYSLHIASGE